MSWAVYEADNGYHIIPVQDLIEHTCHECLCGPLEEPRKREDGSIGWIYTHPSLDNREKDE